MIHNSQSFIADVEAAVRQSSSVNTKYSTNATSTSGRHAKLT